MTKLIKKLIDDESGSVLPMIAVIIILIIMLGSYEIGLTFVYRDRALVRDALDSAVTSALASSTSYETHNTNYYEYPVVVGPGSIIWVIAEGSPYANIYMDYDKAQSVAKATFNKIIGSGITVNSIEVSQPVYGKDTKDVTKSRLNNPSSNPDTSWVSKFGGTVVTWADSEEGPKSVQFPRSVKIQITAQVTTNIPLGNIFGKSTQSFTWTSYGVKELSGLTD